jgi:hypothetical protein
MFWIWAAVVVVALFALAWFVSGFQRKKFGNPNANAANTGAAKGYAAMKDIGRTSQGGNGPGRI